MAVGSKKLSSGHVILFEIDPSFARYTDYFKVDDIETRCAPHADGSPKRSKYISVYRVTEFLPLQVYCGLYLTTPDGLRAGRARCFRHRHLLAVARPPGDRRRCARAARAGAAPPGGAGCV